MVALATPFKDGRVDEEAFRGLARHLLDNGITGLVPVGTTGEAVTMSPAERVRVVQLAVQEAKGRALVIAGAGSNSTQKTVEGVAAVREAGADAALIVTPYYNKPTQAGLLEHYRQVARAHPGFPLVAYNVPGRTGVDLLPDTVLRLCDLPEVVALKEATGSMIRAVELVELCGTRLSLLSGDDFTILPFIACGGRGVISVSGNVAPKLLSELVQQARAGNQAKALELQVKLNPLHRLLFIESNPIPVKSALHFMDKAGPELRAPLVPMAPQNAAKLKEELARLGLL